MIRRLSPHVAGILAGALALTPVSALGLPVATLDIAELHAGQKAVVRTVFLGDSIESFEAEILGVVAGGRVDGNMILARATSERVIRTGVAQGMSGSPVYVDGKLVGALSSGWSFTREPLFGVTPIGEMLAVLDMPASSADPASAGPSGVDLPGAGGPGGAPRFRELRWSDAPEAPVVPPGPVGGAGPEALALPLACAGLNSAAGAVVSSWLAPLGLTVMPGGRAPAGGPGPDALVPGAAVAVDIMRGDLQMSAIGTVTWRDGDRVLIFGHPFFQSGEIRLPMSTAEITAIVPSAASSFKIGVRGREVGVVTQDRRAAVAGQLGGTVRLMPLSVTIEGAGGSRVPFRFETIEDRSLAPSLIGVAALNSLLESGGSGANQTLRWSLVLYARGADALTLGDIVSGDAPSTDLMGAIASPLRFLFNNPFDRLTLDSVAVRVRVVPSREQWTLRNVRLQSAAVRPGGTLHLECEVERWRGGRSVLPMELVVPEEVPDGGYVLWVGGGSELSRYEAKELPARYRPTSLPDACRRLSVSRPSDGLYAALFARAPEVTSDGRDYPELPLSAMALLSSGEGAGDASRRGSLAKLDERRRPLGALTRGELLLQVRVDAKAP
jgi:hypothetical protein